MTAELTTDEAAYLKGLNEYMAKVVKEADEEAITEHLSMLKDAQDDK